MTFSVAVFVLLLALHGSLAAWMNLILDEEWCVALCRLQLANTLLVNVFSDTLLDFAVLARTVRSRFDAQELQGNFPPKRSAGMAATLFAAWSLVVCARVRAWRRQVQAPCH